MGVEIQRNRDVPSIDVLKERKLVSHTEYAVNATHTTTAVKRVIHADVIQVALNFCIQFVEFGNLYGGLDKFLTGFDETIPKIV